MIVRFLFSIKNFNRFLLDKYTVDSGFCFIEMTDIKSRYLGDKIYFDREDSKRKWRSCWNGLSDVRRKIGLLKKNTWYLIAELGGTFDYYVYIDKNGNAHDYSLGPSNF